MEESTDTTTRATTTEELQTTDARVRALREEVAELAASEALDKTTALRVVQLHHQMETLLDQERAAREVELVKLRGDLERFHMQAELDRLARKSVVSEAQIQHMSETHGRTSRR